MPIEYVEGDLISSGESLLAHGCNAKGAFGSGFAGALKGRMPAAYDAYMHAHASGRLDLGSVVWARQGGRIVANCITQPTYGRTGIHLDYGALRSCMRVLNAAARNGIPGIGLPAGHPRIAMPTIGADRGGGDWRRIAAIIEEEILDAQPVVYYLRTSGFRPPVDRLPGL